jgi:hypothetical protein
VTAFVLFVFAAGAAPGGPSRLPAALQQEGHTGTR